MSLIKNPLSLWFYTFIKSKKTEYINREKKISIGYLSNVNNCKFGMYNAISKNTLIDEVEIGDFTYISNNSTIKKTLIGKFCSIGPDCLIGLGRHPTRDFVSTHPIFFSTLKQCNIAFCEKNYFQEFKLIEIGNDVWIGARVIIVDGVKIGNGVIIGAGAVVTKDIPDYAIVGGSPAKIIRFRFEKNEINKLLNMQWWNKDISWLKENLLKFHHINDFLARRLE